MSIALFNFAQGLPWITSLKATNDDEHSDRLNHRYTVGFLLICAFIVTGSPFVFNRITCWVPAQFTGAYLSYTNNYCWISNTYYIPSNDTIPHSKFDRKQSEIGYYQWTPLILFLFALGFYFPRILWRSMNTRSGIDIQYLITKNDVQEIAHDIEYYCQANEHHFHHKNPFFRSLLCASEKHLGNYLRSIELIVKFFYLINSLIQLILIHIILGQSGWFYGFDIWYNIFLKNSVLTDSPYFPRVTLCDLRIREIGNLHQYTVQCVLPINMLNEKVFSLAWFWFIFVFISNLFSLISTLYNTLIISHRIDFIRNLYRTSGSTMIMNEILFEKFVRDFLKQDGILILYLINHNGYAFLASEIVQHLYRNYENTQRGYELRKIMSQLDSGDV
jgi:hypothetical protein